MLPATITVLLLLTRLTNARDFSQCFTKHSGYRLNCAISVDKRSPSSLLSCQEFCLSRPADCLSAEYNPYKKTCELFDVPSPLDNPSRGSFGRYRYRRNINSGNTNVKSCSPSVSKALGYIHMIPNIECLVSEDRSNVRLHQPSESEPVPIGQPEQEAPPPKNPFTDNAIEILPIVPDCPIGERARVQIIDGVEVCNISSPSTVSFSVDRPEKCVEACRTSTFPGGARLPLLCRSATFSHLSSKCSVYHDALNPNGYLEYKPEFNVLYMEKVCIPTSLLPVSCDDVFRRVPQHILLGHAAEILTAASQAECIRECIGAKTRKLDCRSVIHYIDVPVQNCILNVHTRNSRPEYFIPELRYKVDYVELSPCATLPIAEQVQTNMMRKEESLKTMNSNDENAINIIKPNKNLPMGVASVESEWSEWTHCESESGVRERDRQCDNCQERIQQQPCFAKDQFDVALKEFVHSREEAALKSGFLPKPAPSVISFPDVRLPETSQASMPSRNTVEYFGPPLTKVENDAHRQVVIRRNNRLYYY